jgi:hypothetical protein
MGSIGALLPIARGSRLSPLISSWHAALSDRVDCLRAPAQRSQRPHSAGSSIIGWSRHRFRHWPSPWTKGLGTPDVPAIRFARGTVFAATLVRVCYACEVAGRLYPDLTSLSANGGFYFQTFDRSVALPVAAYSASLAALIHLTRAGVQQYLQYPLGIGQITHAPV